MEYLRTPDSRFQDLHGYDFAPHYVDVPDGEGASLRVHYVDEGPRDADPVLMLHGEPSWCYLYRKMIPIITAGGFRAVAPDLIGFGRSDKPSKRSDYTYQRHVDWMRSFVERTDLRNITLVGQDWGGLIGLRLAAEDPDRFARIVAANTFLPTGDMPAGEAFLRWQQYSQEAPVFHVGGIVKGGCATELAPEVIEAYNAPFPDDSYKEGARQFPLLVPTKPDDPASEPNRKAWQVLGKWEKPFLCAFSDSDPITRGGDRAFQSMVPGTKGQPHTTIAGGGHFLQEDKGEELARVIVDWLRHSAKADLKVCSYEPLAKGQTMSLDLVLLGTGSPVHVAHRFGPSQVITDGTTRILVDTGWASTLRLVQAGIPPQSIDAVFFTHLHSDHTTDLADFLVMRWVGGIRHAIPIYGPVGTKRMVRGFQEAMAADTKYRLDHHGDKLWDGGLAADTAEIEAGEDPVEVARIGDIAIRAFEVDHRPVKPAYGFRFEVGGRSIVVSGDTNPCPGLLNGARDAEILVCDSMNVGMMKQVEERLRAIGNTVQASLLEDAHDYHADIRDMAALAQEAGVKHLVLSHILPAIVDDQGALFTAGLDAVFQGKLTVGRDLDRFTA